MGNTLMTASFHYAGRGSKKKNITPPLFIEVPVPSQETDWSYICVLGVSIVVSFYDLSAEFLSLVLSF